ncbi:hypothetical protein BJ138DRAFT_1151491 [Hygrophoropsis aurantiaca]|uniref:Uncharacterized protein n=1 Tax=Hygrophoropsis aurantiaca TaxID=72124 RepID=A0ACB8ADG5_9AGAM|nr:hypothetical protein BJ138DRAFT_1151491 [Hygrophoropsis aurantiaca]
MNDDDQDSLFGSPPPSPARGRSPYLAFPQIGERAVRENANSRGISATQNVGTIALPGSHMSCSELPANLPALSLSGSSAHEHPQPRSRDLTSASAGHTAINSHPAPPTSSGSSYPGFVSPHSSCTPTTSRPSSRTGVRKRKPKPSAARTTSLPMTIPDSSAPLPANFLRNQQALLGIAGLVGGVKPARLAVRNQPRGSTSSNPIIIEDELNPPPIGQKPHRPIVDPDNLPAPTGSDVIASLIKQKNIFPVLESLLKLLVAGNNSAHTPDPSSASSAGPSLSFARPYGVAPVSSREIVSQEQPPNKRRRLSTVPAGAVDWDVPYPFAAGEGPSAYRDNWERERGRQLVTQLVTLIKGAMQNAALRKHMQKNKQRQRHGVLAEPQNENLIARMGGQCMREGEEEGEEEQLALIAQMREEEEEEEEQPDLQNMAHEQDDNTRAECRAGDILVPPIGSDSHATLDRLFASLLSGDSIPDISLPTGALGYTDPTSGSSGGWCTPTTDVSTQDFDQAAFEKFLAELQDFSPALVQPGVDTPAPDGSISIPEEASMNFDQFTNSAVSPSAPNTDSDMPNAVPNTPPDIVSMNSAILDDAIDPVLLAISIPPNPHPQAYSVLSTRATSPSPALSQSPVPSASSLGGPITPRWDTPFAEPEIWSANEESFAAASVPLEPQPKPSTPELSASQSPRPVHATIDSSIVTHNGGNIASSHSNLQFHASTFTRTGPSVAVPGISTKAISNKEDIVRRARERRRQLVTEIERAKVELWETSIEGGVLVQLAKEIG